MFEKPTLIIEFCGIAISLIFVVFLVATWLIRKKDISNLYLAIYFILNFIYQSIRVYQLISPNFENSILINRTEVALTYTILLFCSLFIIEYCKSKVHKYFTIILLTFVMLSVFICFFTDLFIASTIESHTFFNEKFYGVIPGKLSGIFNIVFLSYYGFLIGIIIKYKSQIKFEKTIISIGYGAIIFSLLFDMLNSILHIKVFTLFDLSPIPLGMAYLLIIYLRYHHVNENVEKILKERTQTLKLTFEKLSKSEEKFTKLFISSPDAVLLTEMETGKIIEINNSFEVFSGFAPKEVMGKTVSELKMYPQEERERFVGMLRKYGSIRDADFTLLNKAGTILLVKASAEIIEIDSKQHIITILRNITDQRKAELALMESERKFNLLFDQSPVAIVLSQLEMGVIENVNIAFEDMFQFTRQEVIGNKAYDLGIISQENRQKAMDALKNVRKVVNNEMIYQNKFGITLNCLVNAEIIEISGISYVLQSIIDITRLVQTTKNLAESEKKFRTIFDSTLDNISLIDAETNKFMDVNKAFLESANLEYNELIGKSREELDFWTNEIDKKEYSNLLKINNKVKNFEVLWNLPSGQRYFLISSEITEINSKKVLLTTGRDINELKIISNALKENEEKYRSLFENSGDAIFLNKGNIFIDCNKKVLDLFGCSREEIIGKEPSDFSPEYQPDGKRSKEKAHERIQKVVQGETQIFEWLHCRLNKTLFYADVILSKIEIQNETYYLVVVRDISERKRIEKELEDYQQNLEKMVHERTEEISVLNEELSYTNEELTAINEDLQLQKEKLEETLNMLQKTQAQLIQSEKMAALGVMIAGVAHEINNPINFISSSLSALEHSLIPITDALKEYQNIKEASQFNKVQEKVKQLKVDYYLQSIGKMTGIITEGTRRTSQIIKSLTSYSSTSQSESLLNLNNLLDINLEILNHQIKDKIQLTKNYKQIPLVVGNGGQINQVIMNIIVNAIQSITDKGEIIVSTGNSKEDVFFSITDNGKGITTDSIDKIFDPFFTTKEVGQGTGLGLYLSFEIIKKHHGRITVDSKLGNGSTFTVYFPMVE